MRANNHFGGVYNFVRTRLCLIEKFEINVRL